MGCRQTFTTIVRTLLLPLLLSLILMHSPFSLRAQTPMYEVEKAEKALRSYPIPSDNIFLGQVIQMDGSQEDKSRQDVYFDGFEAVMVFRLYDGVESASKDAMVRGGSTFPVNVAVEALARGDQFHNDLVRRHQSRILDRNLVILGDGFNEFACIQDLNVVVCGASSYDLSDTPGGAAISNAVVGLALLLDATESQTQDVRQSPTATSTSVRTATPSPTVTPRPTFPPTPRPTSTPTPLPTPTPIPVVVYLPAFLPLDYGDRCRVAEDGIRDLAEMADRLGGWNVAEPRLREWGWQGMRYRTYACDNPPRSGVALAEVNVHRFASAADAQAAVDFFAAARAGGTRLIVSEGEPGLGDYSVVVTGPIENGKEFTIYASRGSSLVKVTGVSTSGIPFMDVRRVALDVLSSQAP